MNGLWTEAEIIEFNGRQYLNKRATKRVADKYNLQLTGTNMLVSKAERIIREAEEAEMNIEEETVANPYEGLSPEAQAVARAFAETDGKDLSTFIFMTPKILKENGFGVKGLSPQELVELGQEVAKAFPDASFDGATVLMNLHVRQLKAQVNTGQIYDIIPTMPLGRIHILLVELSANKISYDNTKMAEAIAKAIKEGIVIEDEKDKLIKYIAATNADLDIELSNLIDTPKEYIKRELARVAAGTHTATKTEWLEILIAATYQQYPDLTEAELRDILTEVVKDQEPYHITALDIQAELMFANETKGFEKESGASLAAKVMNTPDTYKYIDAIFCNVSEEKWDEFVTELTKAIQAKFNALNNDIKNEEDRKKLGSILKEIMDYNADEPGSFNYLVHELTWGDTLDEPLEVIIDGLMNYSAEEALKSIEDLVKEAIFNYNYEAIPGYLTGISIEDKDRIMANVSAELGIAPEKIEENISTALAVSSIVKTHPEISKEKVYDYIDIVTNVDDFDIFDRFRSFKPEEITLFHTLLKDVIVGYREEPVLMYMKYGTKGFVENPEVTHDDSELLFEPVEEEVLEEAPEEFKIIKRSKKMSKDTKKKILFGLITGAGIITVLHLLIAHAQSPLLVIPSVARTVAGIFKHTVTGLEMKILAEDVLAYFCTIFGAHKLTKLFRKEDKEAEYEKPKKAKDEKSEVMTILPPDDEPEVFIGDDEAEFIDISEEVEDEEDDEYSYRTAEKATLSSEEPEEIIELDEDDFIPDLGADFWDDQPKGKRR